MSEIIEVVKVTYQEVVQAMAEYYGTEQFLKIAGAGATVEQFLKALKAVPNYNAIVSASGKIIGYEKAITSTIATGSAVSSTATTTVTTTTAFGATATEAGVVATGVGQTTAGTAGSFIFGEVLPAVGAVAVGTVLGVGVDSLIYQSNPDYWDDVLPTINPQTWDDIILGHDTNIPLLHNTQDGTTYLTAESLAYFTQLMQEKGALTPKTYVTTEEKIDKCYNFNMSYSTQIPQMFMYGELLCTLKSVDDIQGNFRLTANYNLDNPPSGDVPITISSDVRGSGFKAIYEYIDSQGRAQQRVLELYARNPYTYNNKTVYYSYPPLYYTITNEIPTSYFNCDDTYDHSNASAWVIYYGTEFKEMPDGYLQIENAITPSNIVTGEPLPNTISKLRVIMPDLFNNGIEVPIIQNDGTATNQLWLPVQLPNINNNGEPISNNATQTFNGTYPNENAKNEAINDVVTPAINTGIANGTPDNDNSTGEEDTPPIIAPITPVQTGLGAVYIPTLEQLKNFSAWLWSSDIVEQVKRLFANPMDGIIGLHQVFFTPTANGSEKIQTGYLTSTVDSSYTTTRYYTIDCGEIALKEKSGNVFDYSPYTSVEIYLPFIGIVPLDVGTVMRSTIHVSYECDVLTGACLANVEINRDGNTNVLYSFGGSCALQYPLSSGSYVGILGAIAGIAVNVGTAIATGGATLPLNIGGVASSIAGAKTSVASSGGYSGNTGAMGIKKPYLIIKRSFKAMPRNYSKYIGNPLGNTKTLNELSGYTECEVVHISGNMTTEEKNEIETILKNGVII